MARAKGYNSHLALAYEADYGQTPASPVGYNMPFNQSKIAVSQKLIDSTTIRARRDQTPPVPGNIDVSGSIVIPLDQIGIGYWLRAMFGNPVTTGSNYHEFKVTGSQPSLMLEQQYRDIGAYELHNGCKVSKFSFTYGGDGELTANVDIIGAKRTVGAASFDADLTDIALTKFSNFQGMIQKNGSPLASVTEATLNVDFGLDANSYTIGGGGCRTDLPEGAIKVSGNIKAFFTDTTLLNEAVNNTKSSLSFDFISGDYYLRFFMEEVMFQQSSPGIENDKGITISLPFKAFYDSGSYGTVILAILNNSQASYTL